MDCPCGGIRAPRWHYRRGISPCEPARKWRSDRDKAARDKKRAEKPVVVKERKKRVYAYRPKVRWTPGTDIVIPEFDPL